MKRNFIFYFFGIALISSYAHGEIRLTIPLDEGWTGTWINTRHIADPFMNAEFKPIGFPALPLDGGKSLILKNVLKFSHGWEGKRVALQFRHSHYLTDVYVNRILCGSHKGGYGIFEIEIDKALKPDIDNEIIVCVSGPELTRADKSPDAICYGGNWFWGIYGRIDLLVTSRQYIDDIFVTPSVRKKNLQLAVTTSVDSDPNLDNWQIDFSIFDHNDKKVYSSGRVKIKNFPVSDFNLPWFADRLWSCDNPYLYNLHGRLFKNGQLIDDMKVRFGFRELWAVGEEFYLNGKKIHLFGDAWHHRRLWKQDNIRSLFTTLKKAGIRIYRGHGPHSDVWFDVADEMGMLLISEGPVYQLQFCDINHRDFLKNTERTYREWIKRVRNHPSLVIYSADNEVINGEKGGFEDTQKTGLNYTEMVDVVMSFENLIRKHDNSRLIMHEGDGWVSAKTDIVNMHYPHESPFWHLFPNTNTWLDNIPYEAAPGRLPWDKTKPLYIGEFGNPYEWSPRRLAFINGDRAYGDANVYYETCGEVFRQSIIGFRLTNCSGIAPFSTSQEAIYAQHLFTGEPYEMNPNPMYDGIAKGFKHEAVFFTQPNTRVYGGLPWSRKIAVFNDSLSDKSYELAWKFIECNTEKVIRFGNINLSLEAASHQIVNIEFKTPYVRSASRYKMDIQLTANALVQDSKAQMIKVFPDNILVQNKSVFVWDVANDNIAILQKAGLKLSLLEQLPSCGKKGMTIFVGTKSKLNSDLQQKFVNLAENGCNIVILPQDNWPDGWLGIKVPENKMDCTIAFARHPDHYALNGLDGNDLSYWAVNNYVAHNLLYKADYGPMECIIDSAGNQMGLKYTAMSNAQIGQGSITVVQLDLINQLDVEPAAMVILSNLARGPQKQQSFAPVNVIAADANLSKLLESVSVKMDNREKSRLLIIDGNKINSLTAADIEDIRGQLCQGKTLFVTSVVPMQLSALNKLANKKLALMETECYQGQLTPDGKHKFTGINDDDLCWIIYQEWGCEGGVARRWKIADYTFDFNDADIKTLVVSKPSIPFAMGFGCTLATLNPDKNPLMKNSRPLVIEIPVEKGKIVCSQILLDSYLDQPDMLRNDKLIWERWHYSIKDICTRIAARMLAGSGAELKY